MSCQSDSHYEYCDWWHGKWGQDKVCEFEWKRRFNGVKRQSCPILGTRMRFVGDYDSHECKVELLNVELSDAGNWTCKMEKYAFVGRGSTDKKILNLEIVNITEPPSTTSPSTYNSTSIEASSKINKPETIVITSRGRNQINTFYFLSLLQALFRCLN